MSAAQTESDSDSDDEFEGGPSDVECDGDDNSVGAASGLATAQDLASDKLPISDVADLANPLLLDLLSDYARTDAGAENASSASATHDPGTESQAYKGPTDSDWADLASRL
jgi:hypothetical protein